MPRWFTLLSLMLGASVVAAEDGKLLYEQNCAACHLPDQMVVGPSLIEIRNCTGRNRRSSSPGR